MVSTKLVPWLKNFNEIVIPNLIKNKFKPTCVNAREGLANLTKELVTNIPDVTQILDGIVEAKEYNVPVRIYNPNPKKELPIIIYYHGGGHMAGSVTVYDPICRKLANKTNHIVISVEYRLAPENPYPAGIIDSYNVVKNIWKVLDLNKIRYKKELSLVGDSGGAANVASVTMKAQFDLEVKIKNQVLIYPSIDYTMGFPSMKENSVGYLLHKSKIEWYFDNYFQNNEDRKKASPLYMEFSSEVSRTLVFTTMFDPLRDEGREYVKQLKNVDVEVEHYEFPDMIHTFLMMEDLVEEECETVYQKINLFLNT